MFLLNLLASYSYSYSYGNGYDYDYSGISTTASDASVIAGIFALIGAMFIPIIALTVIAIVAQWKIFTKAGEAGWKSLIPIYNIITLFNIVNINPLFILVMLIPFVGSFAFAIVSIIAAIRLCKGFGKSDGFIVGYVLLSFIFMLILAFDKSTWDKSRINMDSFSFLNKEKGAAATANTAKTTAEPKAPTEDPWVDGKNA